MASPRGRKGAFYANMAYNPASLTKIKGEVAKISATYISPHGKYKTYDASGEVNDQGGNRIHPAWAPGSYYVKQLNDKEWLGFGAYSRFGNSCQFKPGSLPGVNNTSSKINGMSIGLNYAKKLDSKWSASLGAEVNYAWLQIDKTTPYAVYPVPAAKMQVEGESYALGWNAAANYAFDDKNEMGIVYRSAVNHSMEGNVRETMLSATVSSAMGGAAIPPYTDAYGCVTLPESVMIGYGHKFNDKTRDELNGTWTRWSRFDKFDMTFSGSVVDYPYHSERNWKDGWRYAIGVEHKLSDKYSLLGGIAYDESGIPDYYGDGDVEGADFMVPTGTRTTFTIGGQYHDDKQTLALSIGYMKVGDLHIGPEHTTHVYEKTHMYDSYTKLVSISYQYNF